MSVRPHAASAPVKTKSKRVGRQAASFVIEAAPPWCKQRKGRIGRRCHYGTGAVPLSSALDLGGAGGDNEA
jgi:hypothetical protein